MNPFLKFIRSIFAADGPPQVPKVVPKAAPRAAAPTVRKAPPRRRPPPRPASEPEIAAPLPQPAAQRVHLLHPGVEPRCVPYWSLRGWRRVNESLFLGYFKTPLGRCHGVIKWVSPWDFNFYVHDVPAAILCGPHGACFVEVKPGKFRVHFAQLPSDVNSGIFYIETVLMEGFQHGHAV